MFTMDVNHGKLLKKYFKIDFEKPKFIHCDIVTINYNN